MAPFHYNNLPLILIERITQQVVDFEGYVKEYKTLLELAESALDLIPKIDIENRSGICFVIMSLSTFVEIQVQIPWDTVIADEFLLAFMKLGWKPDDPYDDTSSGQRSWFLRHQRFIDNKQNFVAKVVMMPSKKESKCKLIQVGEEERIVKTPIYKVECGDIENV